MNLKWLGPLALVVLLIISGCHSQELSRNSAKDILNKTAAGSPATEITIGTDQMKKLMAYFSADPKDQVKDADKFDRDGSKPCLPDPSDMRIATGQAVQCSGYVPPDVTWQRPGFLLKLHKPLNWSVSEVTGISDDPKAPGDKIVEYTWRYDLSVFSKSMADVLTPATPNQSKALMRKYDDGWRFVEFR